jgi:electron transfer flavoprotein beta subunit
MAEIVVLLSAGRHPITGRLRPAEDDSRALALAGHLAEQGHDVTALHAGADDEPLRMYGGFGIGKLVRLDMDVHSDALPVILGWLARHRPALILTGGKAEQGQGSGMLPYALAHALGGTCVPDVAAIEDLAERAVLTQAQPGGRRRRLAAALPSIASIAHAAPLPGGWAYGRAVRARLQVEPAPTSLPAETPFRMEPARPLARPVRKARGGAAARMAAATSFTAGKGKLMVQPSPREAAEAIAEYLAAEGLLRR